MTPQQIVGLAARLFALWIVITTFQQFAVAAYSGHPLEETERYLLYFIHTLLPLLLALFLWCFPTFVAHKLVPQTHETNNALRMSAREAAAAGSVIIGIWALIYHPLPHLLTIGSTAFFYGADQALAYVRTSGFLVIVFQCAIGLFLVLKPWFVASKIFPTKVVGNDP